jgi:hypothetical protein
MANWSNPVLTSTYTNFVTEVKDRDVDLALGFDGVSPTNLPTGTIRWNSSINRWQKWSGSAWGELASTYALTTITATGSITGTTLIPTGSTAPANGVYLPAANSVGISTNSAGRAFIDSSGRLLIGTSAILSSPPGSSTSLLQIRSTGDDAALISGDSTTGLTINGYLTSATVKSVINLNGARGTLASPTVVASGDVISAVNFRGWGGTSFLNCAAIYSVAEAAFTTTSAPSRLAFLTTPSGATSPSERMRIDSGGSIYIGQTTTTAPGLSNTTVGLGIEPANGALFLSRADGTATLGINSNLTAASSATHASFRRSGAEVGSISSASGITSFTTTSDYRLKENVLPMTGAVARVKLLEPCRFNFIAAPSATVDGFLAHEVQDIVPEAIRGDMDAVDASGNPVYQGIDQSKLVPLLTGALKEAVALIEDLEARVAALEAA